MTYIELARQRRGQLTRTVRTAKQLIGADVAFACLWRGDVVFVVVNGIAPGHEDALRSMAEHFATGGSKSVVDALESPELKDQALVAGDIVLRGIAGTALRDHAGRAIGALVVADHVPREFDLKALSSAALVVENDLRDAETVRPAALASAKHARRMASAMHMRDTQVLDTVGDAILVTDGDGEIIHYNGAAVDLIGPDLSGRVINGIVDQAYLDLCAKHFRDPALRSSSVSQVTLVTRADGTQVPYELTTSAFYEDNEIHYVGVVRDPVSRTVADGESAQTLQRRLETQAQLLRKLSHEFRNALSGISALSELVRDVELSDDEVRSFADDIHTDARRLARYCDDLLIIETMTDPLKFASTAATDLSALCANLVAKRQAVDPTRVYRCEATPGAIAQVDADRIAQAVDNLLDNAAKYSAPQSVITVRLVDGDTDIRLGVSDNGVGISDADRDRIFDRGFRTNQAVVDGVDGTGIGLTVVKQVAEVHGGHVEVESELGRGSTLTLVLPRT